MEAAEVAQVVTIFNRAPMLLCDACFTDNRIKREEMSASTEKKAPTLSPWPEQWPTRAILDLAVFEGAPLQKAQQMAADLETNRGTFAILGDRGRGKTVMAVWLAEQRRQRGQSPGVYVRSHDLFATIRRAWHPQSLEDEWTVLERYRKAPFLVIDEFQERSESEWENRTLMNIIDHRHANILPTVVIANLCAEAFGKSVGASMVDRISQTGGFVECGWASLRQAG